jgi:hypothetical protein
MSSVVVLVITSTRREYKFNEFACLFMDAILTFTNLRESFCVFKHNDISTIGDELWKQTIQQ